MFGFARPAGPDHGPKEDSRGKRRVGYVRRIRPKKAGFSESLRRYAEGYEFKVGKFGTAPEWELCSFGFAVKSLHDPWTFAKFTMKLLHKQSNSS